MKRCLFLVTLGLAAMIPATAQTWDNNNSNADRGNYYYNANSGRLAYSIRTSTGGGWAWQFTDGSSNAYFHVDYPTGNVGVGTTTPRGKFDVDGSGDIYLTDDPINGSTQSLFLPGHIYLSPLGTGNIAFLQARRVNDAGTMALRVRTANNGAYVDALHIAGNGYVGVFNTSPQARLDISSGAVAIQDNYAFQLRGGGSTETGLAFSSVTEEVRLSHTKDANTRYISLGGYNAGTTTWNRQFTLNTKDGNVGVGTNPSSSYKLAVNGKTWTTEVNVSLTVPGPDYVFSKDYKLPSIESVKQYIDANQHLPEVPSAKEMQENGINVSEMNMTMLKKIEELTLYVIELQRQIDEMKKAR